MASFYAELQVAGRVYPLRRCAYEFTQATGERGRVIAKARAGLIRLTVDVPDDDGLLDWAATPFKPLAGRVVFRNAQGGAALETLAWEAGHCVGYQEAFVSGDVDAGAYVCHLTISAPQLTMLPGGPAAYVSPAARDHGSPQQGLVNPFVVPLLTPTAPVVVPVAETVAEVVVKTTAAAVLGPVGLVLALILSTATPAGGPGIPMPPPPGRDELRLRELVARHAAGTLTPGEEAELIALLGSVKGIHIQKLSDLMVEGPLKGSSVSLPGFHNISLSYTKRSKADVKVLRDKFDSSVRKNFLKRIGSDPAAVARLKKAGLNDAQIKRVVDGRLPEGYQVHHKVPLDDGGDNSFPNLLLIQHDPYHKAITNLQLSSNRGLQMGQTRVVQWPIYNGVVYP